VHIGIEVVVYGLVVGVGVVHVGVDALQVCVVELIRVLSVVLLFLLQAEDVARFEVQ